MTKLRFVLGDGDERYLQRLSDYISFHYAERIEVYSFSKPGLLAEFIQAGRVNGVFIGKGFTNIKGQISGSMAFAYLAEGIETEEKGDIPVLMKYQDAETLVKEMLALCSEQVMEALPGNPAIGGGKVVLFESPMGGSGTTLLSAAYAGYLSRNGKKAVYLNMERFGAVSSILSGAGRFDFGDAIYALKSKKTNLRLKLQSIIRKDTLGAYFIEPCAQPLDFDSLDLEDAKTLLSALREEGFDAVVLDRGSGLASFDTFLRKAADQIILVLDESRMRNEKAVKFLNAIKVQEEREEMDIRGKMQIVYNRCKSRHAHMPVENMPVLGKFPELSKASEQGVLESMIMEGMFSYL